MTALATIKSSPDMWYDKKKIGVSSNPLKYADWKVEDDIVYYHNPRPQINPISPELNRWKPVLPPGLRQMVIRDAHDSPYAAHCGIDNTYHRVSSYFY